MTPGRILGIGTGATENHFELQTPVSDGSGGVVIRSQAELIAGYSEVPHFVVNAGGTATAFRADSTSATIGNTGPRCELREVDAAGVNIAFDALTGTHRLRSKFTVVTEPAVTVPDIVVMQLHNGDADRVAIRTQLVSGSRRLRCRINGTSHATQLASPYTLGTEFDVEIEVVNNTVNVRWATGGAALPATPQITQAAAFTATAGGATWYFKAGCYLQDTSKTAGQFGLVEHRHLAVYHSFVPVPAGVLSQWWQLSG